MKSNRTTIYILGFVFSLPIALMSYINSSFISTFLNEKSVGIVYAIGSFVSILSLLLIPTIFRKIGSYKFLLWITIMNALTILLFAFSPNAWSTVILFTLSFTLNILIAFSLDELLKIFSKDSKTGTIRGNYIALCNLAWIIAQFSLGTAFGVFSFKTIYLVSFIIMMTLFVISYLRFKNIPDPKYDKISTIKYITKFFQNKNLSRIYSINFLLQFFYSWMVIYTPIYLSIHLGFTWREIGIIFMLMLLPFSIISPFFGKYADKIGEREMLMWGFAIISLASSSLFFIYEHNMWIWAIFLFFTRVGAASIEVGSDTYFFKHVKPENEEFVGVYRSTYPVAYILGPLCAFLVLIYVPSFNFIYLILGAIMLGGTYLSSRIKKGDI